MFRYKHRAHTAIQDAKSEFSKCLIAPINSSTYKCLVYVRYACMVQTLHFMHSDTWLCVSAAYGLSSFM